MLKILSIAIVVFMILGSIIFVRNWNKTTPWGTGTGTIRSDEVKTSAAPAVRLHHA